MLVVVRSGLTRDESLWREPDIPLPLFDSMPLLR
jgi:hypothetical protein